MPDCYLLLEIMKKRKLADYLVYQNQWRSITVEQESHFSKFRNLKERIYKDVIRTDRSWQVYKDDKSPYLISLYNILLSYSFFNFDIGSTVSFRTRLCFFDYDS